MSKQGNGLQTHSPQQRVNPAVNLGQRIVHLRQVRGLTAGELARRARVTSGFISQLEHSKTLPSLQTLGRVATALDVPLTYLLLEDGCAPRVVRQPERHAPSSDTGAESAVRLSPASAQHLALITFELSSGAISEGLPSTCVGRQQCYLVLQGTIRAFYGDARYLLNAGDSILWDGTLPHRLENVGEDVARLVLALAPATCVQPQAAQAVCRHQHRVGEA